VHMLHDNFGIVICHSTVNRLRHLAKFHYLSPCEGER
jgi:hypothetical protein